MSEHLSSSYEQLSDPIDTVRHLIDDIEDGNREESPELTDEFAEACAQMAERYGMTPDEVNTIVGTMRLEER